MGGDAFSTHPPPHSEPKSARSLLEYGGGTALPPAIRGATAALRTTDEPLGDFAIPNRMACYRTARRGFIPRPLGLPGIPSLGWAPIRREDGR
jgi:hypothetical protein